MKALTVALGLTAVAVMALAEQPQASVLEEVKNSKTLRIGYREDSPPFSFRNDIGEAAGYSVELCRQVAAGISQLHQIEGLSIDYVPVTAGDRFNAVAEGRIHLLCGATTQTLTRREVVSFSLPTFIDGASVLFRADGPKSFPEMVGQAIGVHADTTTETGLRNTLEREGMEASIVAVDSHEDGFERLVDGEISAYFADRAILAYMLQHSDQAATLHLSNRFFSHEPFALALPRGDEDFRLTVDRVLSYLYKSGRIGDVFKATFPNAQPTDMLKALYLINSLPN